MTDITTTSWLVVRRYRGKIRVVAMRFALSEAETIFDREAEKLRDGHLHLYEVENMRQLDCQSGGYNRTKW